MTRYLLPLHLLPLLCAPLMVVTAHAQQSPRIDTEQVERLLDMSDRLRDLAGSMAQSLDERPSGEVRRLIEDPEALRRAAREMERALEDSDMIEGLAEMAITLSEQVEIVEGEDTLSLSLKGREMLSLDATDSDRVTIRAGGKRITIETD